jgi:hypothetical protein
MIARTQQHAVIEIVWILVFKEIHALELHNVPHQIIALSAHVLSVSSVIHSPIVIRNLSQRLNVRPTLTVHLTPLASIKDVVHHVLKEIHVHAMLNVVSHIIDHSATVHQAGAEIQMFDVINVSLHSSPQQLNFN